MRKAQKLSHIFEKLKRDNLKQSQDTWKSQFQETDQEKLQRLNLDQKYRDLNQERKLLDSNDNEGEDQDQEAKLNKQKQFDQEARAQDYIEVEGQRIFVKGLDLGLLKKERTAETKKKTFETNYSQKISQKLKLAQNVNKINSNKLYREMIKRIENPQVGKSVPGVTQNTHYDFDINWEFGGTVPRVISKQPPRHHKNPSFPGVTLDKIKDLMEVLEQRQRQREQQQEQDNNMDVEDESDKYIFDVAVDDTQVASKLEFNVGDISRIYEGVQKRDIPQTDEHLLQLEKARKRKRLLQEEEGVGYDECYWNTGPSLEELKNLRQEGISFYQFQDQNDKDKNKDKKEKKVNYNKEYEKIQRIIAEKEGKPK